MSIAVKIEEAGSSDTRAWVIVFLPGFEFEVDRA